MYRLAIAESAAGNADKAEEALESSLRLRESAWAFRALARTHYLNGTGGWQAEYLSAIALKSDCLSLLREYGETLLRAEMYAELTGFLDSLPEKTAALPRFMFLRAAGYIGTGNYDAAEEILLKPLVLPDIREGELSLSEIWFRLWERKERLTRAEAAERHPLPPELDFRMH